MIRPWKLIRVTRYLFPLKAFLMDLYRRLLEFVKPYWPRLAGAMICMLFVSATTAASAYLVKPVLDDIFFQKDLNKLKLLPLAILGIFSSRGYLITGRPSSWLPWASG